MISAVKIKTIPNNTGLLFLRPLREEIPMCSDTPVSKGHSVWLVYMMCTA